jgi:hypothetical protein
MDDSRRHLAGKGDKPRPVDYQKWSDNWDRIFGTAKTKGKTDGKRTGSKVLHGEKETVESDE